MSRPRLAEAEYTVVIDEVAAHLREHLPKEVPKGDRSVSKAVAAFRIRMADAEGQDLFEQPEVSRFEIRERLCRNLIALATGDDKQQPKKKKQAEVKLQMLTILFLEDVIGGCGDAATPRALLCYVRDRLVSSLPYEVDRLRAPQVQIAKAVDMVLAKLPSIQATRNQASRDEEHPESACSLVVKALEKVGRHITESTVQKGWEDHGVGR